MRIGLALSGGGFRAALYHLGVVRFLKDAGLLESVTHVTSVSGGSVLAAHLVLNWDRYNGSPQDFDDAGQEILDFIRLDIRDRIVRRYPFALACNALQRIGRRRFWRRLSRTGLLERHYQKHLYGDTCLHQLPASPELHMLSTNLSEGGLASFTRSGLLCEERTSSGSVDMRLHRVGLATVPMAVAASSAFPGFFPPLELTAEDVGATEGEFQTQYFTDGGVYDNLGIRMFRYLEQQQQKALDQEDFSSLESVVHAWNHAAQSQARSALGRIVEIYASASSEHPFHSARSPVFDESDQWLAGLERMITEVDLAEDAQLCTMLGSAHRETGGNGANGKGAGGNGNGNGNGHRLGLPADRLTSNRHLLGKAIREATGEECLGGSARRFDAIVASDAGKKFEVTRPDRAGSFLHTAMRSSDILMDRVWQLEKEHFAKSTDYVFVPIARIVTPDEDATALHPEVQIQVSRVRTDMDRFDDREVSGLIRHGYCVARHTVSTHSSLMSYSHAGPPWDPIAGAAPGVTETDTRKSWRGSKASATTQEARNLQRSSRRTYKSILSPRDWVSYLYVPLFLLLFGAAPFWAYRTYRQVHTTTMLTAGIAETRQDYDTLLRLVQQGPVEPWQGMPYTDAAHLDPLFAEMGLDIITDTRITDLRALRAAGKGEQPHVYVCRLVSVRKVQHVDGKTGLRLQSLWDMPNLTVRCSNPELRPQLLRSKLDDFPEEQLRYAWQLELDFSEVPIGQTTNVMVEALLPADAAQLAGCGRDWWEFEVDADPEVATAWVLLPDHWRDAKTRLVRYENDKPDVPELVEPTHQAVMFNDSILNWIVVHPKAGYTYTYRWVNDL